MPESAPDLRPLQTNMHLPPGGVFAPDPRLYEDLDIPTKSITETQKIGRATIRTTVEAPANASDIIDPIPAMTFGGYLSDETSYEGLRKAVARSGKVTLTQQVLGTFTGRNLKDITNPYELLYQSALEVIDIYPSLLNKLGVDVDDTKYDAYTHSMGGPVSIFLARRNPDLFRSIVMDGSPGLEPHHTGVMLSRLPYFFRKDLRKVGNPQLLGRTALSVGRDPLRYFAEGIMVSNCDIREGIQELREHGIKIASLFGLSDSLVSARNSIIHSGHIPDLAGIHFNHKAHHLWPQTNPFDVAMAFKQALDVLHKEERPASAEPMPIAA